MVTQTPQARRMAPDGQVEYVEPTTTASDRTASCRLYEFEPDPDALLDALLPKYISARLLRGAAGVGGRRVGRPPARDEGGHRQRERADP